MRLNSTRHPFSTSASPMAAARWLLTLVRADQLTGRQKLAANISYVGSVTSSDAI